MNILSLFGVIIVQIALICYSIAIITEQRKRVISSATMSFMLFGVFFDVTATTLMILGSSQGPFTLHGILGYSSLTGMLIDAIILWRFYGKHDREMQVPSVVHWYSLGAYLWWIAAYITGALLVAFRH
jgi:hypothetical protein